MNPPISDVILDFISGWTKPTFCLVNLYKYSVKYIVKYPPPAASSKWRPCMKGLGNTYDRRRVYRSDGPRLIVQRENFTTELSTNLTISLCDVASSITISTKYLNGTMRPACSIAVNETETFHTYKGGWEICICHYHVLTHFNVLTALLSVSMLR
jgi:hypothetical protein